MLDIVWITEIYYNKNLVMLDRMISLAIFSVLFLNQLETSHGLSCIDPDKTLDFFVASIPEFSDKQTLISTSPQSGKNSKNKVTNNDFYCEYIAPSDTEPTSVHALRPGDIDLVAALGDSITAGNGAGADTIVGVINNYRGLSFSVGGYYKPVVSSNTNSDVTEHFTIPNALKRYNPDIKGWASGIASPGSEKAALDMAVAGSTAINLTVQAHNLVQELQSNPDYDLEKDWKLLTVFIGGNNLCQYCVNSNNKPKNFVADVKAALDLLQEKVPRMFVNLLTMFNIDQVAILGQDQTVCKLAHECFCYCGLLDDTKHQLMLQTYNGLYRGLLWDLIDSGEYDKTDDFTVVIQPFLEETVAPMMEDGITPDLSYFAPDCFHFSKKGHDAAGQALWNNMFQKFSQKSRIWSLDDTLVCPTEDQPFIYTSQNSRLGRHF